MSIAADHLAELALQQSEERYRRIVETAQIRALVDAGFWASLLREEGYAPEISLALADVIMVLPTRRAASNKPVVSGVFGQWIVMKSARATAS